MIFDCFIVNFFIFMSEVDFLDTFFVYLDVIVCVLIDLIFVYICCKLLDIF